MPSGETRPLDVVGRIVRRPAHLAAGPVVHTQTVMFLRAAFAGIGKDEEARAVGTPMGGHFELITEIEGLAVMLALHTHQVAVLTSAITCVPQRLGLGALQADLPGRAMGIPLPLSNGRSPGSTSKRTMATSRVQGSPFQSLRPRAS